MATPRRVAVVLIAAQIAAAPLAFAQTSPQGGGSSGSAGGTSRSNASADDEDEDDTPASGSQASSGSGGTAASGSQGTSGSGAASSQNPPAATNRAPWDFEREETDEQQSARRERMLPRFSALDGAIGLLHMATAEAGSDQTFRFGFIGEGFTGNGFLCPTNNMDHGVCSGMMNGDTSGHIGATLTLSYSPIRYLDIFAGLRSYANYNDRERPQLFQVLGDMDLGVKGFYPIARGFSLGGALSAYFLNRAGNIGTAFASTSMNIRLLATLDIQQFAPSVPLRFHLNLGYFLDNSAALVSNTDPMNLGVEQRRQMATPGWNATDCATPSTDPTTAWARNVACHTEISRYERFALGINRADRFNIGIGVDLRTPYVQPFIEWNVGVPVVRSGYICYRPSTGPADDDRCLADDPNSPATNLHGPAFPSTLTLGARVLPPIRGLSFLLAFDIGTTGTGNFARELAPNMPWTMYGALGFAHDFAPQIRRVEIPREVRVEVPRDTTPPHGLLIGAVQDAESHQGISSAIIDFVGHPDFGLMATTAQGQYRSRDLPPGEYEIHVRAPDYNDNSCRGTIPAPPAGQTSSGEITVNCELRPVPRLGNVSGRVTNAQTSAPAGGVSVTLTPGGNIQVRPGQAAPGPQTATSNDDGVFQFQNLPAGSYTVTAAAGSTTRAASPRSVDVRPRETANADIQVAPVDNRGIRITRGAIEVREQIHFQTDSAEILPDSNTLIERIADFISRHPEAARIEIQGHTDNQGTPAHNMTLSQNRAESVRTALIALGVSGDRLTARGYGQTRPIGPNLTPAGRARNRRVVFSITGRAPATPPATP